MSENVILLQNIMTEKNNFSPQYERVQKMQFILNDMINTIQRFENVLNELESKQDSLQALTRYYGDEKWHQDRQSYDEGKFPEGKDYSVLGEDYTFDMLIDHHQLSIRMLEVATTMIKHF
ncbi:DUF4298 domain-containing protein [Jeotgalibaca sp. MA1X17-3]|uniref:DUF4298 domain-containing protein n=1 Tax=Jeotgalibaca sp. MA1X17-3 TaxID=2908211 RepID=UPI001F205E08|nr:DUF4298 domain-containing protein [Jeotgalibaca sp. MA1X17-3]UJF14613.1 DUF4298 domain-containing protein [Jeotgalibaca sp. MA1X17-3]